MRPLLRRFFPCALLLVGCRAAPPAAAPAPGDSPGVTRRVEHGRTVMTGDSPGERLLASFIPAVAAQDGAGTCRLLKPPTGRITLWSFPDFAHATRNVALEYDTTGRFVNYSDLRGDLLGGGPKTSITMNLEAGLGTAWNRNSGARNGAVTAPVALMMESENLGAPRKTIERVRQQCEGGGDR